MGLYFAHEATPRQEAAHVVIADQDEAHAQRHERAEVVNDFLRTIASCGRRFFEHEGRVARIEIGERCDPQRAGGLVYIVDEYTGQRADTASQDMRGFHHGGTLRELVKDLRTYVLTGRPQSMNLGPWPQYMAGGDLWGYGPDMRVVRAKALELAIWKPTPRQAADMATEAQAVAAAEVQRPARESMGG